MIVFGLDPSQNHHRCEKWHYLIFLTFVCNAVCRIAFAIENRVESHQRGPWLWMFSGLTLVMIVFGLDPSQNHHRCEKWHYLIFLTFVCNAVCSIAFVIENRVESHQRGPWLWMFSGLTLVMIVFGLDPSQNHHRCEKWHYLIFLTFVCNAVCRIAFAIENRVESHQRGPWLWMFSGLTLVMIVFGLDPSQNHHRCEKWHYLIFLTFVCNAVCSIAFVENRVESHQRGPWLWMFSVLTLVMIVFGLDPSQNHHRCEKWHYLIFLTFVCNAVCRIAFAIENRVESHQRGPWLWMFSGLTLVMIVFGLDPSQNHHRCEKWHYLIFLTFVCNAVCRIAFAIENRVETTNEDPDYGCFQAWPSSWLFLGLTLVRIIIGVKNGII